MNPSPSPSQTKQSGTSSSAPYPAVTGSGVVDGQTSNSHPEPKGTQPKLFTMGKFLILLGALLVGTSLGVIREFRAKGIVSGASIAASVVTLVFGLIVIAVLGWYANKPEK